MALHGPLPVLSFFPPTHPAPPPLSPHHRSSQFTNRFTNNLCPAEPTEAPPILCPPVPPHLPYLQGSRAALGLTGRPYFRAHSFPVSLPRRSLLYKLCPLPRHGAQTPGHLGPPAGLTERNQRSLCGGLPTVRNCSILATVPLSSFPDHRP